LVAPPETDTETVCHKQSTIEREAALANISEIIQNESHQKYNALYMYNPKLYFLKKYQEVQVGTEILNK